MQYIYLCKNHLGNTQLNFAKATNDSVYILEESDYYPYVMNHLDNKSRSFFEHSSYKNHKYSGKEL